MNTVAITPPLDKYYLSICYLHDCRIYKYVRNIGVLAKGGQYVEEVA